MKRLNSSVLRSVVAISEEARSDGPEAFDMDENLLGTMSVGMFMCTPQGIVRRANAVALKETGLAKAEVIGRRLTDLITVSLDKRDLIPKAVASLEARNPVYDLPPSAYIYSKTKQIKFYAKGQFISRPEHEAYSGFLLLFRNIEGELSQTYILDMALGRAKIYPWFFDMEKNVMLIDRGWFVHLGIPAGDCTIPSEVFFEQVHPDDRKPLAAALEEQLSGKLDPQAYIYRLRRADGTYEWFEEQSVYMGQVDGTPYRVVGICQSVQGHKDIEATLIEARNRAQESDRLKSAFLANMSHEIRTPLNAIVGFSNLLASVGSDSTTFSEEETREYVRLINSNSEQLLMLISDILDLSKIESNTMEFAYAEVSPSELLSDIYQAQSMSMPVGVRLVLDLPEVDVRLTSDPMRLKQVLNNIINNAVKFTEAGEIRIGYRPTAAGKVEFYVSDTGRGIPAEKQSRIFERFFKADSFIPGTGLGLSICKVIVEHLGGCISCVSEEGKGTRFAVEHPLSPPRGAGE